jgi:hypothetical protein
MVLMQQRIKEGALARGFIGVGTFAQDQGQQPVERLAYWRLGRGQTWLGQSLVPHAIARDDSPQRQPDPPSLLQLQHQSAGSHVFELAGSVAPVP